jgi:hypothetical protein
MGVEIKTDMGLWNGRRFAVGVSGAFIGCPIFFLLAK